MDEVGRITDYVQNRAGFEADLIWGNGKDEKLGESISVTIIATGFSRGIISGIHDKVEPLKEKHELKDNDIQTKSSIFNRASKKKESFSSGQKTIEFNISEEMKQEEDEFESLYPETLKERANSGKRNFSDDYSAISDEDVEDIENIPAYQRRQIRMNDPKYKKQISGLTVTSENKISDKNSYLHGQVD